jgi:sulfur-carrier protein adenylyltransferase/sulfurtransferase
MRTGAAGVDKWRPRGGIDAMKQKSARKFGTMFPDDLRSYMDEHREGAYLLLDVRQPEEYEESRLPGSKLMPLPDLAASAGGLDRKKDIIVYCQMGGRSLVAAQFLASRGFPGVFQLNGGIDAWEDRTATGPSEFHLQFVRGDETAGEAALLAYRMEDGLERFHQLAMLRTENRELKSLLEKLVRAEESHKAHLLDLLRSLGADADPAASGASAGAAFMEGGFDPEEYLDRNKRFLSSPLGFLELAMMVETQALDLYLHMAENAKDPSAGDVFFRIAEEEKSHLASLGLLVGKMSGT